MSGPVRLVHLTTADVSLALLLGPQLRAFRDAGYEVIGVSAPGPYTESLEAQGIRHVALRHATRSMSPRDDLAALFELRDLFRELAPTIVHTHNPKPGVYGRIAARLARVPVVVNTVHGLYALPEDRLAKRAVVYGLERIAAACSDAELLQNPEDEPVLRRLGIPSARLHLLRNGVDLGRFDGGGPAPAERTAARAALGLQPHHVVCGLVGRLVWEKGYREVIEAARALRDSHPDLRFVVVGPFDDAKGDALTPADVAAAEQAANISFLGLRNDVEALYPLFDLYVLASHREGFPRSAMEAAAMGLPIVATDIRGCRQVVDHEHNGLLVPARDPGALAGAIARIADDPALRARMADAGRDKARREFDDRRQVAITLGVYDQLLAERVPNPAAARLATGGGAEPGVVRVRPALASDAPHMAALHAERITEGFLPTLGLGFLTRLYRRVVRAPGSFAVVAERDGRVLGFAAGAEDLGRLYREFVTRDGVAAGAIAAPRIIRNARRVLETLRYPGGTHALPDAEILAVAVAGEAAGLGLGRRLVASLMDEFAQRSVPAVKVVAGSANPAALALYRGAGFRDVATQSVHAGVDEEVLVWTSC